MVLKICGITSQEDASAAIDGGANAIGFNFYLSSPRYLAPERAAAIQTAAGVRRVGVFVNESPATVKENFDVVREGWMEQIKTDPRVRYTDILACSQFDMREAIEKIDKPALVIAGADDTSTTPADAEFIAGKIRGARCKIIADAGHSIPRERPAEYNAAIEQFALELR